MDRPFDTVLVANRGEIARRVIRTLRRLGIRSVAVYSDADAGAPHVREADDAVRIGPAVPAQSYLSISALIGAALSRGADALHPGYGFLSESAGLARACRDSGLVFIGPDEGALTIMGDKRRAKEHVAAHGIAVIPGFGADGLTDAAVRAEADTLGYPLLVKPSAGGGGTGMQTVGSGAELGGALEAARRIASAAFGDDRLILERLIDRPRHLEVQVLADAHGTVLHLGERECTLQRRHQKVVEEAPSPVVSPLLRERLGAAACAVAASVDYRGVGTVEFLVSAARPDEFFFIEMNTRLQVEHPVTEAVTGIDLVEQQLRTARGEHLAFGQSEVRLRGHAIEARVYAETPERGFLPSTGEILLFEAAAGVRTDAAVATGSVVTTDYDPMIAKVIAHGSDRNAALARLDAALRDTVVLGVDTNVDYLRALLATAPVQAGDLDTGLIERLGVPETERPPASLGAAAACAIPVRADGPGTARASALWLRGDGWRAGGVRRPRDVRLRTAAGDVVTVTVPPSPPAGARIAVGADGTVWAHVDGRTGRFTPVPRREAAFAASAAQSAVEGAGDPEVRAPMPGSVVAVHVSDGARVAAGDRLVTIEAMKMEHPVAAPHDGVARIRVAEGEHVGRDQVVARVDASAQRGQI